ncbi:MAG TPA: ATP synthase F1 subunit delta [Chitinophagaceae bacterium]|jgi:F-type H+-transporting ATPase subunit delta|nr:ATP synthase F1 subunit delta [Chitinophagaceae bacterium]
MLNPRLASRYAKSMIDLAQEQGQLEAVYADMLFLQATIRSSRDLLNMLRSPVINADKKNKVLEAITAGRVTPVTAAFNKLLVAKGREAVLPEITQSFVDQYKKIKGIHTVFLTTATPVSENMKSQIVSRIRSTSDMQNIELETKVDPNLIGGFTLQAGDKLIDASVVYDLKQLAKQFQNNDFIYRIQ